MTDETQVPQNAAPLEANNAATILVADKYFFKKDKLGNKRPTMEIPTPHATPQLIAQIFNNGGKEMDFLLDVVNDVFFNHVKLQLNDETKPANSPEDIDYSKLEWSYIATIPPAERRGAGISADVWEAFSADYVNTMTGKLDRSAEQIATAATLFVKRLAPVKWRKPVLTQLQQYLKMWYATTPDQDTFTEVYKFLDGKIVEFLNLREEDAGMNI